VQTNSFLFSFLFPTRGNRLLLTRTTNKQTNQKKKKRMHSSTQLFSRVISHGAKITAPSKVAHFKRIMTGIYPPIPTPFEADGSISFDKLTRLASELSANNPRLGGLTVLGSNGEYPALTHDEKLQVWKTVSKAVKTKHSRHLLIAGCGTNSTSETVQLCNEAADLGYDAALVLMRAPSFCSFLAYPFFFFFPFCSNELYFSFCF
jgi:hypothetical protein